MSTASKTYPCVIIENYKNGIGWYRIWLDGWIEQSGQSQGGGSNEGDINTFFKSFENTNYTLTTSNALCEHLDPVAYALIHQNLKKRLFTSIL